MPIIIDTNCIANVFSKKSVKHLDFQPVLEWIISGKGIAILGGTKYTSELRQMPNYIKIFRLLKDSGKAVWGDATKIDTEQMRIENLKIDPDFDDPHLPAIVICTKCQIICSEDTRSIKFVTDKSIYPKGIKIPAYYTSKRNIKLLCDNNIDSSYKPLLKLGKQNRDQIEKALNGA